MAPAGEVRSSAIRIASTRCCGSSLPTATRRRAWSSSRSAATGAAISVSIPTSTCSCCSAAASAPPRSGSSGRSCTRSGTSASSVGHQVRELDDFRTLEADNPEFLLALLDARPVAGARVLFDRFSALFHTPETHAHILTLAPPADRRAARAFQRDALPAGARRQGSARGAARPGGDAHDRAVDRSAAPSPRPGGPGAVRRRRGLPAAGAIDRCTWRPIATRTCSVTSCRSAPATCSAIRAPSRGSASND